ncbi:MAG: hypothetical protein H6Q90_5329 [Deltaproteobacteria bacterium]|nr:hypothetical protein [Deltaproteobacteria bacterium]
MTRGLLVLALVAGCSKEREAPAPAERPAAIPAPEVQRGLDACAAYVAKVCACAQTAPDLAETCTLAKSLPEAIEIGKRVAAYPSSTSEDAAQAASSIRKTVKQCIEQTAQLPSRGCS